MGGAQVFMVGGQQEEVIDNQVRIMRMIMMMIMMMMTMMIMVGGQQG